MPLEIIREDILKLKVDAIVNPSNRSLTVGNRFSVSGQIFGAAGFEELSHACEKLAPIEAGEAVLTSGFNLGSTQIIHVVGPRWMDGQHHEEETLANCYKQALAIAKDHQFESIAFPLLSSGHYHFPKDKALQIALREINAFVLAYEVLVYLVVYDKTSYQLSTKLTTSVKNYLAAHLQDFEFESQIINSSKHKEEEHILTSVIENKIILPKKIDLKEFIKNKDESFSDSLFRIIDAKKMKDVEVYKRANISKAVFSKIRSNDDYKPLKTTALALCIGLQLNLTESREFLSKAGIAFSRASTLDLIVQYFIEQKQYDINTINIVLYDYDQALLGSSSL